jgi:hypothetical protein
MVRKLLIEVTIDWKDYDDVSDELIFGDVFEFLIMKDGVYMEIVASTKTKMICPHCGGDKPYPTAAMHCNRCAMTTEI